MNSSEMLDYAEIGSREVAPELPNDERRIRQGMRLKPDLLVKKTHRTTAVVGGAALLAGGFCLGWKAFRFWRE